MGDGFHGTMQPEMTASEPVPPPRLKKLARLSARREQEGKTVSWVFICTTYFNFLLIQKVLKSAKQDKRANVLFKLILREDLCLLIKPPLISRRQAHKSRRTDKTVKRYEGIAGIHCGWIRECCVGTVHAPLYYRLIMRKTQKFTKTIWAA